MHAKATKRATAVALLASLILAGAISIARAENSGRLSGPPYTRHERDWVHTRSFAVSPMYRGHSAAYWAWQFRRRTRQLQGAFAATHKLRTTLLHRSSVVEAINLTCAVYGFCSTLWRKADCETGGTFSARAHNRSGASGLFQFLPSTWARTPFGRFSIWSPYANALAAGWMHAQGRGGEWVCR